MGLRLLALLSQVMLLLPLALCNKSLIQLNYQINTYPGESAKWNQLGQFVLNKNQIFNTSNAYEQEKDKLIEQLKRPNFDYVLFQLCDDADEKTCIQTYVGKKKIQNVDDFFLLIGLNNNYLPHILNYRTSEELEEDTQIFSGMLAVKVLSVSVPITVANLKTGENAAKSKSKPNEEAKKEKPKSFIRKYWIYVAIFFLSLSISRHFTEGMQQAGGQTRGPAPSG
ncbi:conserved Plasmodium protein, unknown function [Plasmodium knowlesi strain H]|uniref:ER membrane protein complex subunit 10 n=3 Tax=Plasmodium knowlesi TaxID=5850 RepID=A0A5K1V6Z2_PLAKH|nr:conserved Plasmodium protein, unknown function [Plasmodium knowlesi strain H]OTN66850.1 Uncharacterized protein PKNOH_S08496800 [Plasmodium knowlesi]CAA9986763.1 conserved Plasmodium protein, unknown function [Plasmodium knowlesi strain H]SBO23593.1 conserved Plasmodium protein, unknown function [Plasmodium knowlesi strain H]SBO25144.1 conserved Plasmodium protein, unknown function [Plasmodium knowlesi strain H]VVS76237.1 conserved Plasmodium protein, unknown function [Plasmodium knowlesi s|eukprot:XP_002257947.1 hypothetical protein, conserved in Plasmodium species [Plasmodium knowlesi strain H]